MTTQGTRNMRSEPAPERDPAPLIVTEGGAKLCEDCWRDVKSPFDNDSDLYVSYRTYAGCCDECGGSL